MGFFRKVPRIYSGNQLQPKSQTIENPKKADLKANKLAMVEKTREKSRQFTQKKI